MASDYIEHKLALLPDMPGCYLMKNINGKIIYVGKAKNLKNRVDPTLKVAMMAKLPVWFLKLPTLNISSFQVIRKLSCLRLP